jgi:hypothetical protein
VPQPTGCVASHTIFKPVVQFNRLVFNYIVLGYWCAIPKYARQEARHDCHAAICSACHHHDVCCGRRRRAALAVPKGGVSDDAAGHGAKDSCADGIGTRDGATGASLFSHTLNWLEPKSTGSSLHSGPIENCALGDSSTQRWFCRGATAQALRFTQGETKACAIGLRET